MFYISNERKSMRKTIPYGVSNYEELVRDNGYFVDKTKYIELLEYVKNPIFLRPKRFGKSMFCRILECYYNIRQKDDFEKNFGQTYIGKNPTSYRNSFFVLHLDFSDIDPSGSIKEVEEDFNHTCNLRIKTLLGLNKQYFKGNIKVNKDNSASSNFKTVLDFILEEELPPLFVIIDEYDNFANKLIVSNKKSMYMDITDDDSFLKTFFKTLKRGRKEGQIFNVFITGVLPIMIDDIASGFNIGTILTLEPGFESMLGFTQSEVDALLDEIYQDYELDPSTRNEVSEIIKNQYNGYHFVSPENEPIYNSTILMYFLRWLCTYNSIPEELTDLNLKTELSWVKLLTGKNIEDTEEFVWQLTSYNTVGYDKSYLISKFNMSQFFEKSFFPVSFFYLGMLTKKDDFTLKLPNLNMHKIFVEYFNELHHIDVSTRYAEIMQRFVNDLDLHALFAGYWKEYISQLPEAIFQQVNENFYRTTFYELCSRFLSKWFTWNVERSYPQGKTDLEFVGKYNEKHAGVRMVIEFKYYSNAKFKKKKTGIEDFQMQKKDTIQIQAYSQGLQNEYPNAKISKHVIYCFGNKGFKVFDYVEKV